MAIRPPWSSHEDGILLAVRVTPKSARDGIEGVVEDAEGRPHLKVRVTSAPEDGKANAALERLLARTWKLAKSRVRVVSGATSRDKRVLVSGDPQATTQLLQTWLNKEFPIS